MQTEIYAKLRRAIDNKLYTISDVMSCEFEFQGFIEKNQQDMTSYLKKYVFDSVKKILSVGELPHINTDFQQYGINTAINDEKLLEYIGKNAYYVINDLDNKRDHVTCYLSLKLIFLNFSFLDEDSLKLISHVKIKSFMGESELGESKKN